MSPPRSLTKNRSGLLAVNPVVSHAFHCVRGNVIASPPGANLTYSFRNAYQLGSVEEIVPGFDLAAHINTATYAAVAGGSLVGNGASINHHTFGLVFCNTGQGGDGSCPSNLTITNMAFSYQPDINNGNYGNACDFSQASACDSNTAHPDWVKTMKDKAVGSFVNAFAHIPAITQNRFTPFSWLYGGSNNPPFDHTVYVDGSWQQVIGPGCPDGGFTTDSHWSKTYYLSSMCGAQLSLGPLAPNPAFRPAITDTANMQRLVIAIGKGIGTDAVHETGHQLQAAGVSLPFMECDGTANHPCEDDKEAVYEFYKMDDWNFLDSPPLIDWSPTDRCNITKFLLNRKSCQ